MAGSRLITERFANITNGHLELFVATNSEIRSSHTNHGAISNISKSLGNQSRSSHLSQPGVIVALSPVLRILLISYGEHTNLMAQSMQILNSRVVSVLMGHKESSSGCASIGVQSLRVEELVVNINVLSIHSASKGKRDHLRYIANLQLATLNTWSLGTIRRAVTVRQDTFRSVANICSVRILLYTASVLIRTVGTVRLLVTEERSVNTFSIAAL